MKRSEGLFLAANRHCGWLLRLMAASFTDETHFTIFYKNPRISIFRFIMTSSSSIIMAQNVDPPVTLLFTTLDMITLTIARMVRRKYFDLPILKGKLVKTILLVAKVVTLKQIVYSYLYYHPNNHTEKMNELITS